MLRLMLRLMLKLTLGKFRIRLLVFSKDINEIRFCCSRYGYGHRAGYGYARAYHHPVPHCKVGMS